MVGLVVVSGCTTILGVDDDYHLREGGGGSGTATSSSSTATSSSSTATSSSGSACVPVDDSNPCTNDVCENGAPTHPPTAAGRTCSTGGTLCDGKGTCVECLAPTDCAGVDDECKARTCVAGVCGVAFTATNTSVAAQTAGDCKQAVCDGNGNVVSLASNNDVPADDGNACTNEACSGGAPSHPAKANGAACSDGDACIQTDSCQAGACVGGNPVVCSGGASCVVGACVASACGGALGLPGGPPLRVGQAPTIVVAADLHGDGKSDLVTTNYSSNNVSVLLNLGNGAFAAAVSCAVGSVPVSVAALDLNGDGKPDLAVATSQGEVSVRLNLGNGTFAAAVNYAGGSGLTTIAAADLNADGRPDLVTAGGGNNKVNVLFNTYLP